MLAATGQFVAALRNARAYAVAFGCAALSLMLLAAVPLLESNWWAALLLGGGGPRQEALGLPYLVVASLLTAARAGLGLAVLPCIMARGVPELVSVPTRSSPLTQELWLLFHRDIGRTPAVRIVIDHITAIIKQAKSAFLEDGSSSAKG